jgi:Zn-dependent protease
LLIVGGASPPACAGLLLTLLVHELGHALLVWRFHLAVLSIDVHGLGGACRWTGPATDVQRALVAWGGVLAQLLLVTSLELIARLNIAVGSALLAEMLSYMTAINLVIILLNLLPIPPLDGAQAWQLFRWQHLARFGRRATLHARKAALEREIARLARTPSHREQKERKPTSYDLH